MGGVIAQDMFKVKEIVPHPMHTPELPNLVELPLIIVNGTFRCLDQLEVNELENFLRYLCKYTAGKEQRSRYSKPVWWVDELLPFSLKFAQGSKLLCSNDKIRRMRCLVKIAYHHYASKELLKLSSKFSKMHVLSLQFKACDDSSLIVINKAFGNVLVRIPVSNVEYDYGMPMKKHEFKLIEVVTLDDEGSPVKQVERNEEEEEMQNNSRCKQNIQPDRQKAIEQPVKDGFNTNERLRNERVQNLIHSVDTIELSDSDDDVPVVKPSHIIKSRPPSTPRRSKLSDLVPSPKKKLRLFDKLNSLQKNGCVSIYPCISLSDDEEDDDCQIVEEIETNKCFSQNNLLLSSPSQAYTLNSKPQITESRENNYQDQICQPSLLETPTLSSQDTFLSNFGLIKKDRLEEMTVLLQSHQPRRRLRRLRLPLYHMPINLLPLLVARGIINPAQLDYNPCATQERKMRRKKPIRYNLPNGVRLKNCSVVLTRLPISYICDL